MSHKKSNSRVHVPFSWEKMPGVPKFMASPICGLVPIRRLSGNNLEVHPELALPLPPGSFRKPIRSVSKRVFLWEEDPFLAATIECTKDCDKYKSKGEIIKKSLGNKVRKSKSFFFSCKHSFDIEEGHLSMKPSSLGSILHRERL